MKRKAVAAILALACLPAVHGQIQQDEWLEYQKVPVEDRESLKRHCAIIPREPGYSQDLHCLAGWEALWVGNREDWLFTTVQAAPYGSLCITCRHRKKDGSKVISIYFHFRNYCNL